MKILVTGAAGFIGSKLMYTLRERGDEVVGIDNFNDYYDVRLKEGRCKAFGLDVRRLDIADKAAVDALGMDLGVPSTAENIRYSVIDGKIAQIDFTYQGKAFCLRASKEEGDIAGLYGETVATKDLAVGGGKLTQIADGESTLYKAEWSRNGANYVLTNTDGATEIQIIEVYEEVRY